MCWVFNFYGSAGGCGGRIGYLFLRLGRGARRELMVELEKGGCWFGKNGRGVKDVGVGV